MMYLTWIVNNFQDPGQTSHDQLPVYVFITGNVISIILLTIALGIFFNLRWVKLIIQNDEMYFWVGFICLIVFNTTFNNISVILWRPILLVEETGGPVENHRLVAGHWQTLSHSDVHLALIEMVIGTDCIGSFKSNYHTITATTAPFLSWNLNI